jgi:hypothetical protein
MGKTFTAMARKRATLRREEREDIRTMGIFLIQNV